MNPKNGTVLCIAAFLIVVLSASPCFAQYYAVFPGGAAFRFNFMAPNEVDAGREFEVIAFAEHVSSTPRGTPLIRITATPSPIIIPIPPSSGEVPMYCDPNWCLFPWMVGMDQESKKMKFMVDPTAAPGSVFILKVDVSDNGVGWQNEPDIRVRVKCPPGQQWDTATNTCKIVPCPACQQLDPATNTCKPIQCPAGQPCDVATNTCKVPPVTCNAPCTRLDPNTNTCISACTLGQVCENGQCLIPCSPDAQRNPLTNACETWLDRNSVWVISSIVVALVAIGILAVFLLTRKKPAPSAGYKPYYPTTPAAPMLKPGAPQAVKPAAHRPMVIARREEEKK